MKPNIVATFRPQRTDDLHNGAGEHIGYRGEWQFMWTADDGPFVGQDVYVPADWDVWFGWVPASDLTDVEAA